MSKSKLLQLASGVSPITMWSVAFIWDMLWFMIISISVCITLIAFQQDGLSTASEIGILICFFIYIGWQKYKPNLHLKKNQILKP